MTARKLSRTVWTLAAVVMAILVLSMTSATQAEVLLRVDFNSNQDTGGDSTAAGDPGQSAAAHNQDGWSSYHANHEVTAEFTTADYDGITVTPAWPNTTNSAVQQSIDRATGNDANWDDALGYINLVTDWIGIDTRTGGGGNGNWDGASGTPTYMTLALGGLNAGSYAWTSFHHDTEHCHGPFAVWLSTDGGVTFTQLDDGLMTDSTTGGTPDSGAVESGPDVYELPSTYHASFMANGTDDVVLRFAPYSDAAGVHRQIWGMNGFVLEQLQTDSAAAPNPQNAGTDVLLDTVLTWTPGTSAVTHDVYLGSSFEDVNSATVPVAAGLNAASFDPDRLEFGQTYYWRVDEVSSTGEVFRGPVWRFEAEPYAIMIPVDPNLATASSDSGINAPAMTVNGSGLVDSTHSANGEEMWLSAAADLSPWLMYEFDQVQKLDKMLIWNSNSSSEGFIGWGIKDVNIETSIDGVAWTAVAESIQISRAPGLDTYNQPDAVDLGLALAKYVRINILSNWGGLLKQYGVAEIQFYGLPVYVRTPDPVSGSVDILPDSVATWRAGREAVQHTIYIDTDPNAVADGSAFSVSSSTNSLAIGSLDPQLGETYYWRVDEVNDAEAPSVWEGPVWNLSTVATLVVDNFESYSNKSPNRPFQTWLDGYGYSADEFFPVDYPGNGTGSGVGHDIWGPSSPNFNGSIMETGIVKSGSQSMPVYYNNSAGGISEATRKFADPQNWALYGIQGLKLWFYGDPANTTTQMYVKINNTRINYPGDAADLQQKPWQPWYIDLTTLSGVNLTSVTQLTLGFDGGVGVVYIDDIELTPEGPNRVTPVDPGNAGLVAHYTFEGNVSDSAGGNNGTVTGFPQYTAGKNGQAIKLNGTDDFVQVQGSFLLPTYSVSMWFRAEDLAGSADLLSLYSESGGHGILLELSAEGAIRYLHRFPFGTGGGNNVYSGPGYDDQTWYHVAIVKTEDAMTLYVNGQVIGSVADDTQFTEVPSFTLGVLMHNNLTRFFLGELDDMYLYGRALSQAEIAWLAGRTQPFDN